MITDPRPFWEIYSAPLEALATVVVAVFAVVQVWKERRRDAERRRATDAQISVIAFQLRRQLKAWLGDGTHTKGLASWHTQASYNGTLANQLDAAETRMTELLKLASSASPRIASSLRRAYIRFYTGTAALESFKTSPDVTDPAFLAWADQHGSAPRELKETISALEQGPVDQELLRDEQTVLQAREGSNVFSRMADDIIKEQDRLGKGSGNP